MKNTFKVLLCVLVLTLTGAASGPAGRKDNAEPPIVHNADADTMRVQGEQVSVPTADVATRRRRNSRPA